MTWFKVDDGFWSNPKVLNLSDGATALWVRAGSYCCQHLTDGLVKAGVLRVLGSAEFADELVESGLWDRCDGGFMFHDWAEYQELAEVVKERREQAKQRQRKRRASQGDGGKRNGVSHGDVTRDNVVTDGERHAGVTREFATPDPTRPDPTRPGLEGEESPSYSPTRSAAPNGESVALAVVGDGGAGVGSSADDDRGVSATGSGASKKAAKKRRNYAREYSPEFERFWSAYPKKAGKGDAFDRFLEVVADGISVETLVRGAENYAEYVRNSGTDSKHVKNPQGWLSDGRWEDSAEYVPESATAPPRASWDDVLDGMSGGYPGGISGEYSEGGFLDAEVVDAEPVAPWESRAIGGGF